MNRSIKFRAWDIKHKEMVYINDLYWFEENGVHDFEGSGHYSNYEFMQFSGLCDNSNNKNEVYEGDIIEQFGWKGEYYIVEFIDCAFYAILINNNVPKCLRTKYIKLDEMYDFQVLGNKYENLDFLEEGGN